jgi:excinuclease ABC subunit A
MSDRLEIINATTHNLKNVSLSIPKNTLTVVTGVSGSGKSSLAFDTIYALGQQKYLESLSTYARMIISWGEQEAQVEEIKWLSPTISINQKTVSANPRSTVGTITEIYDYLRLLYATIGLQYCPNHPNTPLVKQTVGDVESKIDTFWDDLKLMILSPLDYESEITFHQLEERVVREGFVRYSIGDSVYQVGDHANDTTIIDMSTSPYIAIVIDRLMTGSVLRDDLSKRKRLRDSVALAFRVGIERMALMIEWQGVVDIFHSQASCSDCGYSAQSLSLRDFSFNSHHGACPDCHGLGMKTDFIEEMVVNPRLTLAEWALLPWAGSTYYMPVMIEFAHHMEIPTNVAYHTLTKKQRHLILNTKGTMITLRQPLRGFSGTVRESIKYEWLLAFLRRKFSEWSDKDAIYKKIIGYASETICPVCDGYRLKESSLFVRITTMHIGQMAALSVRELIDFFATYVAPSGMQEVVDKILKNIIERLDFLSGVGLEYVTLDRRAQTLSGGEAQRIRLATQIWSKLEGVIYVLDEPSIGLHSRDNDLLIANLHKLANLGNTVIVVEHDEDIMRACDYIVDIWPRAGVHGWQIVAKVRMMRLSKILRVIQHSTSLDVNMSIVTAMCRSLTNICRSRMRERIIYNLSMLIYRLTDSLWWRVFRDLENHRSLWIHSQNLLRVILLVVQKNMVSVMELMELRYLKKQSLLISHQLVKLLIPISLHTLEYSLSFVKSLRRVSMLKSDDLVQEGLASIHDEEDVNIVNDQVPRRLKCTFFPMYTVSVNSVMVRDTIKKHLKLHSRERVLQIFSRWLWKMHLHFLQLFLVYLEFFRYSLM